MRFPLPLFVAALAGPVLAMAPPPGTDATPNDDGTVQVDGQTAAAERLIVRLRASALPGLRGDLPNLSDAPGLAAFAATRQLRSSRPILAGQAVDDVARAGGQDRDLLIELKPGADLKSEQALWAGRPEVEWAGFDWLVHTMMIPNDTYFPNQWGLRNTQQTPGWTLDCDIDADQAWDITTGSNTVKIAIVDTGVDLNHPDLQNKIIAGYDFVNNDATPDDDHMHGTACASLAAALSNNATGVTGVDWQARIMPIKVLNSAGQGFTSAIISGINWARTNGANVISMSLGGGGFDNSFNSAITTAFNAGVFVVAASGNDNASSISYPALYTNCFSVGALSPCNTRKSPSSCDGENWWGSNYGTDLDVMAPGVLLRSATINGYITDMNGTSGACPHVAGAAALLKGLNPALTPTQIRDYLRQSADNMGAAGWDAQTGYGRLNVNAALLLVAPPDPCVTELIPPSITHTPLGNATDNGTPYPVAATVTDACGVATVTLRWQVNGGTWSSAAMVHGAGNAWSGAIPAQPAGGLVHYQIVAVDASSHANSGNTDNSFTVLTPCQVDVTPPAITDWGQINDTTDQAGPYVADFLVEDACGVSSFTMSYTVNGGAVQPAVITPMGAGEYLGEIPGQPAGSLVAYTATAVDNSSNHNTATFSHSFSVLATPINQPPVIHIVWLGPSQVQLNWAAVPGATFYKLFNAPGSGGAWTFQQNVAGTSIILPVADDQRVIYRVTAAN